MAHCAVKYRRINRVMVWVPILLSILMEGCAERQRLRHGNSNSQMRSIDALSQSSDNPNNLSQSPSQGVVPYSSTAKLEPIAAGTLSSEDPAKVFAETVHPLLKLYCKNCHASEQSPRFAVADPTEAFKAVEEARLINTTKTIASRFYKRLADQAHSCWGDCQQNAGEMLALLDKFAGRTADISNIVVPVFETTSKTFADAVSTNPPRVPGLVTVEAEAARLEGAMVPVNNPTASRGVAIWTPNGTTPDTQNDQTNSMDRAIFSVNIVEPGLYYLFGRASGPSNADDSFFFRVGNNDFSVWNVAATPPGQFLWSRASDRNTPVELEAGFVSIEIRRLDAGAALDALALSMNPDFIGTNAIHDGQPATLTFDLDDPKVPKEQRPCPGTGATLQIGIEDFGSTGEVWRFKNPIITAAAGGAGIDYRGLRIVVNDIVNPQYATYELVGGTVAAGQSTTVSPSSMLVIKENPDGTDGFKFRFDACGPAGSLATPRPAAAVFH